MTREVLILYKGTQRALHLGKGIHLPCPVWLPHFQSIRSPSPSRGAPCSRVHHTNWPIQYTVYWDCILVILHTFVHLLASVVTSHLWREYSNALHISYFHLKQESVSLFSLSLVKSPAVQCVSHIQYSLWSSSRLLFK